MSGRRTGAPPRWLAAWLAAGVSLSLLLLAGRVPAQEGAPAGPGEPARLAEGDAFQVVYWPGDSLRAAGVREIIRAYRELPALPDSVPSGVTVYLAPSEAALDSLTGGSVPEWGAGVAIPGRRAMVIPAYPARRTLGWSERRVVRHEWAHLGLHQHLGELRAPRWLDEGYAEWASGGWDAGEAWKLRLALAAGRTPPLDSLTLTWPVERGSAEIAYFLSATAVEYLIRESGERGLELFLRRWREGGSFEAALRRTYGVTSAQLEEDWRKYVESRYGWLTVLSNSVVSWGVLGLLLLALYWIRRRRDRERMARLRATEPPERPDWWSRPSEEHRRSAPGPAHDDHGTVE